MKKIVICLSSLVLLISMFFVGLMLDSYGRTLIINVDDNGSSCDNGMLNVSYYCLVLNGTRRCYRK